MDNCEVKVSKHQLYVENEKRRRTHIKKFFKTASKYAVLIGVAIGGYVLGKSSKGHIA